MIIEETICYSYFNQMLYDRNIIIIYVVLLYIKLYIIVTLISSFIL